MSEEIRDPVPPGHGEPRQAPPRRDASYAVIYVLLDGVEREDSVWGRLDAALDRAEEVRREWEQAHYRVFVGVYDENDPERGLLSDDEEEE